MAQLSLGNHLKFFFSTQGHIYLLPHPLWPVSQVGTFSNRAGIIQNLLLCKLRSNPTTHQAAPLLLLPVGGGVGSMGSRLGDHGPFLGGALTASSLSIAKGELWELWPIVQAGAAQG